MWREWKWSVGERVERVGARVDGVEEWVEGVGERVEGVRASEGSGRVVE